MSLARTSSLNGKLPATANCGEALAWLNRQRRIVERWDHLPDADARSMTPALRKQAENELDELERSIRRAMAALYEGA